MKNAAYFFITTISIVITLIYGKTLLIPFVFALLLWFLVRKIRHLLDKIELIKKHLPSWLKNLFPSLIILTLFGFISRILLANINTLANSYPIYEANIEIIINNINQLFNINVVESLKAHATDFDFGIILKAIFKSLTDLLSNAFIIVIYALFIFLEEVNFSNKLKAVFPENEQYEEINNILNKIEGSITNYIGLKTLVSIITGAISYIILLLIGIDSPVFWAFLIFLLNYIPTIGSLIAALFPALFCLLQFGEFTPFLMVLFFVGSIQVIVGNILEPKLMGNSLNISSFVTIFALSFWGTLWGVTGMLLSIPITVIMVIIFAHFESTKSIAILLSEKGKIN
ncbi:MAG: AI-2E family transporter [Vicingus serpentipes]|nr:AI-2E family transporter [Vicingus serpentipes]